jgi:hypothetical protein
MNDPRTARQHNASVKTADWLARLQAHSQSTWNRNVRFRTSAPHMPPAETKATQAATAQGQSRRTTPVLPPTASQRAVQAVTNGPGIVGGFGYRSTTVPQHLAHRNHTSNGPG